MLNRKVIIIGSPNDAQTFLTILAGRTCGISSMINLTGLQTYNLSDGKNDYMFCHVSVKPQFKSSIKNYFHGGELCIVLNQNDHEEPLLKNALATMAKAHIEVIDIALGTNSNELKADSIWNQIRPYFYKEPVPMLDDDSSIENKPVTIPAHVIQLAQQLIRTAEPVRRTARFFATKSEYDDHKPLNLFAAHELIWINENKNRIEQAEESYLIGGRVFTLSNNNL